MTKYLTGSKSKPIHNKCYSKLKFAFGRVENVGKGENAG